MPRVHKAELLEIEMVAELVAEGAQERAERRDFLANRRPHPDPDQHGFGSVVPEKFGRPSFAHSQRSGCKHAEAASRDFVELRCGIQKFGAGAADIRASSSPHRRLDGFCDREQTPVLRQVKCPSLVTLKKTSPVRLARRSVCKHHVLSTRANWQKLGVELIDLVFNVEVNFCCGAVLGYLLTLEFHF